MKREGIWFPLHCDRTIHQQRRVLFQSTFHVCLVEQDALRCAESIVGTKLSSCLDTPSNTLLTRTPQCQSIPLHVGDIEWALVVTCNVSVVSMLDQRHRYWPSIAIALAQQFLIFSGANYHLANTPCALPPHILHW